MFASSQLDVTKRAHKNLRNGLIIKLKLLEQGERTSAQTLTETCRGGRRR